MHQLAERTAHAPNQKPDYARAFVMPDRACVVSGNGLRMHQYGAPAAHAPSPRLHCARACSEMNMRMRQIFEGAAHALVGERTARAPTRTPELRTRVFRGETAHAHYPVFVCACLRSVFVLCMCQVRESTAHAHAPRAICPCATV